jgi:hypothetical protein
MIRSALSMLKNASFSEDTVFAYLSCMQKNDCMRALFSIMKTYECFQEKPDLEFKIIESIFFIIYFLFLYFFLKNK